MHPVPPRYSLPEMTCAGRGTWARYTVPGLQTARRRQFNLDALALGEPGLYAAKMGLITNTVVSRTAMGRTGVDPCDRTNPDLKSVLTGRRR